MNSSRRGVVYGFKLESLNKVTNHFIVVQLIHNCSQLSNTRSTDRKMTLLHYIVYVVETVFPHISTFYDDLHLEDATTGMVVLCSWLTLNSLS